MLTAYSWQPIWRDSFAVQSQGGQWADSDEEEEPALYRTDEFRIRVMKVGTLL